MSFRHHCRRPSCCGCCGSTAEVINCSEEAGRAEPDVVAHVLNIASIVLVHVVVVGADVVAVFHQPRSLAAQTSQDRLNLTLLHGF